MTFQRHVFKSNASNLLMNSNKEIRNPNLLEKGRIEDSQNALQVIFNSKIIKS